MSRRGWLLFSALCLIWGVPYLLIKVAVTDLDPLFVAFGRTLLGGLLLLPIALRRRTLLPVLKRWRMLLALHGGGDQRSVVAAWVMRSSISTARRRVC